MRYKSILVCWFAVLLCNATLVYAQDTGEYKPTDKDKFQDYFFEALKQKGIENYDKAIVSLEKCLKLEPQNATVHFELGKNYLAQKNYNNAITSFEKANEIDPTNKWFLVGIYDVNYATKDFVGGIMTINKLIPFDAKFKEDLTSLYMNTSQFDKALALINELNETVGKSDRREAYKIQILSQGKYQSSEIENLLQQIKKAPKEESNYVSLIYLYSKNNDIEKVLQTAKELEKEIPSSVWAQVSLFKYHLENKDGDKAVKAMNLVLESSKIDSKIKHRILNEFLLFVNINPQYAADLEKAVGYFDNDSDINVAQELGKFYHSKQQYDKAIQFYEIANQKSESVGVETNLLLLQAYTDTKQFDKVAKKATDLIDLFPNQPQFYYFSGLGNNQLGQFKKAKEFLEMGMDFVVEDKALEINFNIQLGEAYNGLGDMAKKELYFSKANQLLKK
ncbi:cytochrome C biosynthesis protein [Flavobacterium faecale]|uniref:Cytochrome C biosynthesis protein n=1 Tax=Flavobacterium faecale TaxID=1355330 RepID=A0A2S1LAU0_9FLAO|nr:tetratricopeptide repeat protein [Flavobacterium faecale]AWG20808.1 cytochrome C biosynthesis protein [Flavobacterium faecale]